MRNALLEELQENGYVIIEDFLKPDEIETLLEAGRKLCTEAPKEDRKVFSSVKADAAQSKERYFIESGDKVRYFFEENAVDESGELKVDPMVALNKVGHALHTDIEAFQNITCCDRIREICFRLGYKRPAVPQSMYIFKNAGIGGEVMPHQDSWYLHTEPNSTIGFWIALQDATPQNGCLQFIKGSHKSGVHRRYIRNPDKESSELLIYDRAAPIYPQSSFTTVPVPKGTLVLIDGNVVHKSDLNRSNQSRHAYTFHVIETANTKYSEENWLQPADGKPFPIFYESD